MTSTPWWAWMILGGIAGLEANDAWRRELGGRAALWSVVALGFDICAGLTLISVWAK